MRSLLALSSVLVACGGGGGGGAPAASGQVAVATKASLDSSNYVAVAQEALSSSSYLADSGSLATGAETSNTDVLVRFGEAQAAQVSSWFANAPALATGATVVTTKACTGGGSLTVTETDLNGNNRADAGDSVSLAASNCVFQGSTLNGGLTLTLNSITGNTSAPRYAAAFTMTFNNLSARSATATNTGNGTLMLSLNVKSSTDQSFSLTASQFKTTSTYGSTTYNRSIESYTVNMALTASTSTTSAFGTLTSSAFDSKFVTIDTPVPFVRQLSQPRPASGQATVTGANGAMLRLTALSSTQVRIELDADANGTYETSVIKLWSELI